MRVFHSMSTFSPDFIFWGETIFCLVTPETETRFTVKNIWCTKQPYMKKKNFFTFIFLQNMKLIARQALAHSFGTKMCPSKVARVCEFDFGYKSCILI